MLRSSLFEYFTISQHIIDIEASQQNPSFHVSVRYVHERKKVVEPVGISDELPSRYYVYKMRFCSGVILTRYHILTSGSCIRDKFKDEFPIEVMYGYDYTTNINIDLETYKPIWHHTTHMKTFPKEHPEHMIIGLREPLHYDFKTR